MLRELAKITDDNELDGITALELEAAAANLRASQFIWRDKRNQSRHYDLIVKFQSYFQSLFEAFGDTFFIDHNFGYCGILPRSNRPSLKLRETVFLLILAKMHDTEIRKACTENGRSRPSEAILLDEYVQLTGKEKPGKSETKESLERLARYGVIELGETNKETELRQITILPSILKIVNDSFLTELSAFAKIDDKETGDVASEGESTDE